MLDKETHWYVQRQGTGVMKTYESMNVKFHVMNICSAMAYGPQRLYLLALSPCFPQAVIESAAL